MRKFQIVITYVVLAVSIGFIWYVFSENKDSGGLIVPGRQQSDAFAPEVRQPNLVLNDLAASAPVTVDFSEKPTVLLLFTSWCPYCNEDAPKLVELEKKYRDSIRVIGVNLLYKDDLGDLKGYVEEHEIEYPVLLDDTGDTHRRYGKDGFPALYFIDAYGNVIDSIIGSTDQEYMESSFLYLQDNFT